MFVFIKMVTSGASPGIFSPSQPPPVSLSFRIICPHSDQSPQAEQIISNLLTFTFLPIPPIARQTVKTRFRITGTQLPFIHGYRNSARADHVVCRQAARHATPSSPFAEHRSHQNAKRSEFEKVFICWGMLRAPG